MLGLVRQSTTDGIYDRHNAYLIQLTLSASNFNQVLYEKAGKNKIT